MKTLITCLILIQFTTVARAELDQDQQKGLYDTQNLLKSSSQRQEYFKKDPRAKDMDNRVDALAGSKDSKQNIYELSSDLMEKITTESNGDPGKMQQLLNEAQKNPEAFYNRYFSPEQKVRLKQIADKIDAQKARIPPTK